MVSSRPSPYRATEDRFLVRWAVAAGLLSSGDIEGYTTRNDSINARVDSGPDDDEARNQGDRFDNKGRRNKDDD